MSIQTIALPLGDRNEDPDYYAGRADAYDEHNAGADADTLDDRFDWMTDPTQAQTTRQLLSTGYLAGYQALIQDLRADQHFTRYIANTGYAAWLEAKAKADTELADLTAAALMGDHA
ncbi:hypothetical protein [Streptomyces sp. NPDC055105]|uniref:hypothetical protein n=1 Tax=Streptomyces sp. NPDC055105 TaxID=3365719 RepID=UPI0037D3FD0B